MLHSHVCTCVWQIYHMLNKQLGIIIPYRRRSSAVLPVKPHQQRHSHSERQMRHVHDVHWGQKWWRWRHRQIRWRNKNRTDCCKRSFGFGNCRCVGGGSSAQKKICSHPSKRWCKARSLCITSCRTQLSNGWNCKLFHAESVGSFKSHGQYASICSNSKMYVFFPYTWLHWLRVLQNIMAEGLVCCGVRVDVAEQTVLLGRCLLQRHLAFALGRPVDTGFACLWHL